MTIVTNAAYSQVIDLFRSVATNPKHNHAYDFGFPSHITFPMFYQMYKRNGFAHAGIAHAVQKTWREYPVLLESAEAHKQTKPEKLMAEMFDRLSLWSKLAEVDERSRSGKYAALVFRFADGKRPDEPVESARGYEALVDVIPCYEDQLKPTSFDMDPMSLSYGSPTMYQFNEPAVDPSSDKVRVFNVHPSRVLIWSRDGTIHCDPVLEPGYNDLVTIEKIIGSGGEGFWKNAKSAPILNIDPTANLQSLATMLGTDVAGIADAMDEVVAGWQKGFDQLLMLQGIDAKALGITLPQPAEFIAGALQSFAASITEPLRILVGSQSGERASTEDAKEWDSTIMSRRENYVKPNIKRMLRMLAKVGIIPALDWHIGWSDLTEDSMDEKIARAERMANINKAAVGTGERYFTGAEIREVVGLAPLGDDGILAEDESTTEPQE